MAGGHGGAQRVSIPVLVNLRLGEQWQLVTIGAVATSQFLFW